MKIKGGLLVVIILHVFTVKSMSQNIEEIGLDKKVKANGSVNLNSVGYLADGIEERREPFNWFLTGNLNVNLLGYSAPFSFSYSNLNKSYSQPFNQFSFAPSYKWVKTYIGYNSMTFSNYTLAGHVFLGGGIELTPGKWRVSAMYGRLRKPVEFSLTDSLQHTNASFKRMGYGLKVGYEDNGNAISANIFAAKDDVNSILFILPESELTPMQNVAISITGRKQFLKYFFIDAEYGISALNRDTRANSSENDSAAFEPTHNLIKGLLPENSTNRYYDALNASVGYMRSWYSLQIKYERIAPEYQTLGAYYFNNDLRNITLIPTLRVLKNTLTLSGNAGFQRNNLDNNRTSTTTRSVGAVNANYLPNEKWNFNLSYSNFSSYTNMRPQPDPNFQNNLDTLNFYQVSETMMGTVMRNLGSKDKPQTIMVNLSYQKAKNHASYEGGSQVSNFISTNVAYTYSIVPSNTTLSFAANVYSNNAVRIKSTFYGPTASITKSFLEKKLRCSLATSYNQTKVENIKTGPVLNNRLNVSYAPTGKDGSSKNNFSLGVDVLRRFEGSDEQPSFTELTGTVNYTYTF